MSNWIGKFYQLSPPVEGYDINTITGLPNIWKEMLQMYMIYEYTYQLSMPFPCMD